MKDKYTAVWVSHSSITDFLKCPRAYFLHNIYKKRGEEMLSYLGQNPGPLKNLAVKIKMDLPYYYLSEQDNIILCGKIDWLEYLPESDSVHIIDFKTGRGEEDKDSLQLPIYHLLVTN